jgi:hypothetical protein
MGEIIHYDIISADCIEHVTGITRYEDKIFISSKASSKSFASYSIEATGKLRYDPTYYDLISNDIRHISTYGDYLVVIPKETFEVYLVNPKGNDIVNLKIYNSVSKTTENLKDYILSSNTIYPSKISRDSLMLTACIINKGSVYFFVQSRTYKVTNMFVIKGSLCEDKLMLTQTFKLLSYYNLYNVGIDACLSKKHSRALVCTGVTYNQDRNIFVFLMVYNTEGCNGILGTLDVLDGLNSVGGYIHPVVTCNNKTNLLIFNDKPRGLTYYKDDIYYIITNGIHKSKKHFTKYFIVKIINVV